MRAILVLTPEHSCTVLIATDVVHIGLHPTSLLQLSQHLQVVALQCLYTLCIYCL